MLLLVLLLLQKHKQPAWKAVEEVQRSPFEEALSPLSSLIRYFCTYFKRTHIHRCPFNLPPPPPHFRRVSRICFSGTSASCLLVDTHDPSRVRERERGAIGKYVGCVWVLFRYSFVFARHYIGSPLAIALPARRTIPSQSRSRSRPASPRFTHNTHASRFFFVSPHPASASVLHLFIVRRSPREFIFAMPCRH